MGPEYLSSTLEAPTQSPSVETPVVIPSHRTFPLLKEIRRLPAGFERLFHSGEPFPKPAPSTVLQVASDSGRTLTFRHWYLEKPTNPDTTGPVLLLIHGLGGRSQWMSPFARSLMEQGATVIGLDMPRTGFNPTCCGDTTDVADLVAEVEEAITHVHQESGRPVALIGLSLGGMLTTHIAAKPPQGVAGMGLIAPAFQAAPQSFDPGLYVRIFSRFACERFFKSRPQWIQLPYNKKPELITRNLQTLISLNDPTNAVAALTSSAYLELLKWTVVKTPRVLSKITIPVLVAVPGQDRICSPKAMIDASQKLGTRQVTGLYFPEAFHDIVLEPEATVLAQRMASWAQGLLPH
jgi:alpha-beta hydrolase superfamily lysophospholipase